MSTAFFDDDNRGDRQRDQSGSDGEYWAPILAAGSRVGIQIGSWLAHGWLPLQFASKATPGHTGRRHAAPPFTGSRSCRGRWTRPIGIGRWRHAPRSNRGESRAVAVVTE